MSTFLGEFFGTLVLIVFGCGVVANVVLKKSRANGGGDGWIVITAGWAFAVMVGVFCSIAVGGAAELNPSVTLFKYLIGVYTIPSALMMVVAQFAGAIVGSAIVWLAYLPHWEVTEDKGAKLGVFCTAPAVEGKNFEALITEIIATAFLITIFWAIGTKFVQGTNGVPAGMGVYITGMVIWAVGLSLGGPSGYAMSAARDLGPRIAHAILPIAGKGDSNWGYAWVPVVGPLIGAVIAFLVCKGTGIVG
jgi:glycerol uptake facilitator protein